MARPTSLWDQYRGKAFAAIMRGSGHWLPQPYPCALEPPFPEYDRDTVSSWECFINDWDGPFQQPGLLSRLFPRPSQAPSLLLPEEQGGSWDQLVPVVIERFPEDEPTLPKAEQFLLSLRTLRRPLAFELVGVGPQPKFDHDKALEVVKAGGKIRDAINGWEDPYTTLQFVASREDAPHVQRQLLAHYPNSAVVIGDSVGDFLEPGTSVRYDGDGVFVAVLALSTGFCFPLKGFGRYDPDPLGVAIAAMEHLERDQWALLQVVFARAAHDWSYQLGNLTRDPYKGEFFFSDLSDRVLSSKFASPLFAVSVRLVTNNQSVFRHLDGWGEQFAAPPQEFVHLGDEEEREQLADSIADRSTHRPGMILNLQELSSLVHIPNSSVFSDRLRTVKTRTRPAPTTTSQPHDVVLGTNTHRGLATPAVIPAELRLQHCYITGASGTGKSTLLLNLVAQDLEGGNGLAVLDPHGDLIDDILQRIPPGRQNDVILFDVTDTEHPVGLNILAAEPKERERVVAETVATIHRFYPDSWGPRLEHLLTHALLTMTRFKGKTLLDVRRLLTDDAFRDRVIQALPLGDLKEFWLNEYPRLPQDAADPILNKLGKFLGTTVTKNIVAQPTCLDFDRIINGRKILLCNLSAGGVGQGVMSVLGTFIVTKLLNAALRRESIPREQRIPFYLYVDEFQNFASLSTIRFDTILVEARKYKLALTLANQYLSQVPADVREALYGAGTLITFRVGVNDAATAAKQFGIFTADEVLNLERGHALVRPEVTGKTFNLATNPPPPPAAPDPAAAIIARSRATYAKPRAQVEAAFNQARPAPPPPTSGPSPQPPPNRPRPGQPGAGQTPPTPPPQARTASGTQGPTSSYNGPIPQPPPQPKPYVPPRPAPSPPPPQGPPCPQCGQGVLMARSGPYGPFLGCSTYPSCRYASKLTNPPSPASPPAQPPSPPSPPPQPAVTPPADSQLAPTQSQTPPATQPDKPKPKLKRKKPTPPPMKTGEGSLEDWVS